MCVYISLVAVSVPCAHNVICTKCISPLCLYYVYLPLTVPCTYLPSLCAMCISPFLLCHVYIFPLSVPCVYLPSHCAMFISPLTVPCLSPLSLCHVYLPSVPCVYLPSHCAMCISPLCAMCLFPLCAPAFRKNWTSRSPMSNCTQPLLRTLTMTWTSSGRLQRPPWLKCCRAIRATSLPCWPSSLTSMSCALL